MKFKVGSKWFDATPDTPIMVVLTEADKRNIANMLPNATMYAVFHDDMTADPDFKSKAEAWMIDADTGGNRDASK